MESCSLTGEMCLKRRDPVNSHISAAKIGLKKKLSIQSAGYTDLTQSFLNFSLAEALNYFSVQRY